MVLGGSPFQLPIIQLAKRMGLHVISCDYLPDNPGHEFSDEYYNVSTTEKDGVLHLAKQLDIDAIMTFSSDPAIPTVAYVAKELGLEGPCPDTVNLLSEKDKFRLLLADIGLNVPENYVVDCGMVPPELEGKHKKMVVKPVDSCGSKGITFSSTDRQELLDAIEFALDYSRSGKCILEEYIPGHQIHGDGYMQNGELIYHYYGDQIFYTLTDNFIPISTCWPCKYHNTSILKEINSQVEQICRKAGYLDGPLNIEARIREDHEIFVMEVSPRNGGNYVPRLQEHLTGFDFTKAIIYDSLGIDAGIQNYCYDEKAGAYYVLHSEKEGLFEGIKFSDEIKNHIFFHNLFKNKGETVDRYIGSHTTIGIVLLEFDSIEQRDTIMRNIENHIQLDILNFKPVNEEFMEQPLMSS